MPRFFADFFPDDPALARLDAEEMHHARDVMRLRPGESVTLMISGHLYASAFSNDNRFPVLGLLPDTEPRVKVTLFQGIPKGDKMETICQKCTEAGVLALRPVRFDRCVAVWDGRDVRKKTERLARIIREAAKQSGRCLCPEISPPLSVGEMCASFSSFDSVLIPWEGAKGPGLLTWRDSLEALPRTVALVIGPEGGITEDEIEKMAAAGGQTVTLGPRILRTETAGLCALTAVLALTGCMEGAEDPAAH